MSEAVPRAFDPAAHWPVLVGLQQRSMQAQDEAELLFLIANETWHLVPYSQACLFLDDALGRQRLRVVSGLVDAPEDTPFTLWLERVCDALAQAPRPGEAEVPEPSRLQASGVDAELRAGWTEWWPRHALHLPLVTPRGNRLGTVLLVRDDAWTDAELALLKVLHATYAHVLATLRPVRPSWSQRWPGWRGRPLRLALLGIALTAALCCPVHVSVLAPAEIIALNAEAVAAPVDGVIKTFHVPPNRSVKRGEVLFSLDDTTMRNRREIASRSLAVARADMLAVQQKSFDNAQSRAELASLQGRVQEKEAELSYVDEALTRIDVRAEHDGVLIYGDPNDWLGKPVVTGERIAQLAQPEPLGVLVWLPVGDAISLDVGAALRVYLQAAPLTALSGELTQTSYQASLSPEGVSSYRIRGRLDEGQRAHIGLRGVVKVYGGWEPAIYWLLRRPLGALRQWVGV